MTGSWTSVILFVRPDIPRITGNFCGVKYLRCWSKKKTFNFCGFFFCRLKISAPKNKLLYYRKRCYDQKLVHITVVIRSKNIFNSLESFQRLQLLNTHLVNFKLVLRNIFFTVFAIYFVDMKYEVNSWIDISKMFDISDIYFLSNFHTLSYNIFFKRIMIKSNYIQFF